jgi:hypothetical protein
MRKGALSRQRFATIFIFAGGNMLNYPLVPSTSKTSSLESFTCNKQYGS